MLTSPAPKHSASVVTLCVLLSSLGACASADTGSPDEAVGGEAVEAQAPDTSESVSFIEVKLLHGSGEHQVRLPVRGATPEDDLHVKATCSIAGGTWTSVGVAFGDEGSEDRASSPFSLEALPESPTACTLAVYSGGMTSALKLLGESCWTDGKMEAGGPCSKLGAKVPTSSLELTQVELTKAESLMGKGWLVEVDYTYTFGPDAPTALNLRATCEVEGGTAERSVGALEFMANAAFSKPGDRFQTGITPSIGPFEAVPEVCTVRFESSAGAALGTFCLRDASTSVGPC